MKPAFALDFRNDAVSLLHRTTGGWHQVGRVAFDDPDMPAALGYLRSTALGLSPRGVATKLILPDDQILVTTLDAPGPDEASRMAQIRAGLEGRTPYQVDELIFDWEAVGGEVRVAVIARETLAEAEAFATEHRFNPVSFAAAPASGFTAEPWFGPTSHAAALLADGEVVERDIEQITVLNRGLAEEFAPAQEAAIAPQPEAEAIPEPEAEVIPAPEAEVEFIPAPEVASEPEADIPSAPEVEPEGEPLLQPEVAPTSYPAFDAPPAPQADLAPWPTVTPQEDTHFAEEALPEAFPGLDPERDDLPEDQQAVQDEDLPPPLREQPVFGLADDEAPPSQAIRAAAPPRPPTPRPKERRGQDFWGKSQSTSPAAVAPALVNADLRAAAGPQPSRPTAGVADEAPMALDVEDDDQIKLGASTVPSAAAPDDVPPMPGGYSPSMGFASRRASADQGAGPKLAAPPRPSVARPSIAKPLPPASPRAERPMVDRPTAVNPTVGRETKGLRGLGALVGAPGLTGGGRKKVQIPPTATAAPGAVPAQDQTSTAAKRPSALTKSSAAGRAPVRGKPRHLGLILTGILLLLLALIAAYSTTLAFRSDDSASTEFASADSALPAPEDEMLADGVMMDELPADEVALAPEADLTLPVQDAPEAAVDVSGENPATAEPADPNGAAAVATASSEPSITDDSGLAAATPAAGISAINDIVIAAKDPAPKVPSPLDPPEAVAQGDPLPTTQAAPPPFGTVYQFDAKGMIVPTPEGIITPEGVRLVAGKPPRVPKSRPENLTAKTPAAEDAAAETTAPQTMADPALAGARPKARPEGLIAPGDASEAPAVIDNRLVGKRPMARPEAVLAAGEAITAAKASAAASLAAQAEAAAANAPASQLAIAISRRPAPRPVDLSRAVEAAVAAAIRSPEPTPEPDPQPEVQPVSQVVKTPTPETEAPQPTILSSKPPKTSGGRDRNQEEADAEPELASVPSGGSKGSVSKQATFKNALNLDKTALIGIYGTPSNRYAMIRTAGGRYKKVTVGDRIDGGRIQAITASELRYQKGSRLVTLALPRG